MKIKNKKIAAAYVLVGAGLAANLNAADFSRLGNELTPVGAERAGNADGSIPAWTGGLTKAPAGWKAGYANPFAGDKPVYSINGSNIGKYQSLLPRGQVELVKTYPGYRIDVYPTRRSCGVPDQVAERTKQFAGTAKIGSDGWRLEEAAGASVPFPIPRSGAEALWNYKLRYMGHGRQYEASFLMRDNAGALIEARQEAYEIYPYNSPDVKSPADTEGVESKFFYEVKSPSSRAGELYLLQTYMDKPQDTWIYFPGQRRVRLAPSFAYDNPIAGSDNLYFVDQSNMFTGAMDRYDLKLIGKKEMIVPYNSYKLIDKSNKFESLIEPKFLNRDVQRYEKHRVWVVEATLKSDKRHSFAKREFYFDEDSWGLLHVDMYDAKGNLWRSQEGSLWADPNLQACTSFEYTSYDLIARRYIADAFTQEGKSLDTMAGIQGRVNEKMFSPNELRRRGAR